MFAPENREYWKLIGINSAIGLVFVFTSFPELLRNLSKQFISSRGLGSILLIPVTLIERMMMGLIDLVASGPEDVVRVLMACCFVGLFLYFLALAVFALRHRDPLFIVCGVGGLVVGALALHLISWIALVIVVVLDFLSKVLALIINFISVAVAWLIQHAWWILLLLLAIYLLHQYREHLVKIAVVAAIIVGVGAILFPLLPGLWRGLVDFVTYIARLISAFWDRYVTPIFKLLMAIADWIFRIAVVIFYVFAGILLLIGVLTALGHLVVDQIKAGLQAGHGRKGVLLAAFAIGSAITLVFLTCVANPVLVNAIHDGWTLVWQRLDSTVGTKLAGASFAQAQLTRPFVLTMPPVVRDFVFEHLTATSAPVFDIVLLVVLLILSYVSILHRTLDQQLPAPDTASVTFYPKEYFAIFGGLILQVVVIFAQVWSVRES